MLQSFGAATVAEFRMDGYVLRLPVRYSKRVINAS